MSLRPRRSIDAYLEGIRTGDRAALGQAITLVESSLPEDQTQAEELLQRCLPYAGRAFRVGLSGPPGAGKSTFIERFGLHVLQGGAKLAVLAVDPSSQRSSGSILGDKTRMEELAANANAFIRPSPAGATLGGVNRRTRETILLCEAAGYNLILVETVGVGQSETLVQQMTDCFLLMALPGTGDELQGIKRGVMELANAIILNKADGGNLPAIRVAKAQLESALHLFPKHESGVTPAVLTCSALEGKGVAEVWAWLQAYGTETEANGYHERLRQAQQQTWFAQSLREQLEERLATQNGYREAYEYALSQIANGEKLPQVAAQNLLRKLLG
jgi:LAO/AO transport system kinase